MASAQVMNTVTIVDPFDELTNVSCSNEQTQAALTIAADLIHEAMFDLENPEQKSQQMYQAWLLLELTRQHVAMTENRLSTAETALYKLVNVQAVHKRVRAMRGA